MHLWTNYLEKINPEMRKKSPSDMNRHTEAVGQHMQVSHIYVHCRLFGVKSLGAMSYILWLVQKHFLHKDDNAENKNTKTDK